MVTTLIAANQARSRAIAQLTEHMAENLYAAGYKSLSQGQSEHAARSFMLMASVVPCDPRAWVGLGASLEQRENWHRALGAYTLGRTLAPTSVHCKLGEARALAKLGRHSQAQCVVDAAAQHANHIHELQLVDHLRAEL